MLSESIHKTSSTHNHDVCTKMLFTTGLTEVKES